MADVKVTFKNCVVSDKGNYAKLTIKSDYYDVSVNFKVGAWNKCNHIMSASVVSNDGLTENECTLKFDFDTPCDSTVNFDKREYKQLDVLFNFVADALDASVILPCAGTGCYELARYEERLQALLRLQSFIDEQRSCYGSSL